MTREWALVSEVAPTRPLLEDALNSCLGAWQLETAELGALRVLTIEGAPVLTCWPASEVADQRALEGLGVADTHATWLMPLAVDDAIPPQAHAVRNALERICNGRMVVLC